jgi:hypothetical protein
MYGVVLPAAVMRHRTVAWACVQMPTAAAHAAATAAAAAAMLQAVPVQPDCQVAACRCRGLQGGRAVCVDGR